MHALGEIVWKWEKGRQSMVCLKILKTQIFIDCYPVRLRYFSNADWRESNSSRYWSKSFWTKRIYRNLVQHTTFQNSQLRSDINVIYSNTEMKLSKCRSASFLCKSYVHYVSLEIEVIEPLLWNKRKISENSRLLFFFFARRNKQRVQVK